MIRSIPPYKFHDKNISEFVHISVCKIKLFRSRHIFIGVLFLDFLDPSANIVYGFIFPDLPKRVFNVQAYNPDDNYYYGISSGRQKLFLQSKSPGRSSSLMRWKTINLKQWNKMKASASLITAIEVPFIPVLLGDATQPYNAFLFPSSASRRRRRSAVSYDMWGGSNIPVILVDLVFTIVIILICSCRTYAALFLYFMLLQDDLLT